MTSIETPQELTPDARSGSVLLSFSVAYSSLARCIDIGDAAGIKSAVEGTLAGCARELGIPELARSLEKASEALRAPGIEEKLSQEHTRLFSLSDALPYESAYDHPSRRLALISDIAGFMRAFGVESSEERPDFVGTELEFSGFLALLEARAELAGEPERSQVARDARRTFIAEHAGRWLGALAHRIREKSATQVYPALLDAARALLVTDAAMLGADVEEVNPHLEPSDGSQSDCSGCAVMAGTSGGAT